MENIKENILGLFVDFWSRYVSIPQAQAATLGGRGYEAKIWLQRHLPNENGWLVECSPKRAGDLVRKYHFRNHNQLKTFHQILAGHGEKRAYVDSFHLDLNGTLCNQAIANFSPVLPLVLKSKGRCLAITMADSRRNLVLEQWSDFKSRATKLFGEEMYDLYDRLLVTQKRIPVTQNLPAFIKQFDPVKGARREMGLLVELTELLRAQDFPWAPVTIERYVYVSRYGQTPFRMRTYFFHFENKSSGKSEIAFARTWVKSRLLYANKEGFKEVVTQTVDVVPTREKEKGETMPFTKLSEFMEWATPVAGPAIMAEYEELIVAKSQAQNQFQSILQAVEAAKGNFNGQAPVTVLKTAPDPGPSIVKTKVTKKKEPKVTKSWDTLTAKEKIALQIEAKELKAKFGSKWDNGPREQFIKEKFGNPNKKDYKKISGSLRASLAHTSGSFQEMFKLQIQEVFGEEAKPYLDRLAKL